MTHTTTCYRPVGEAELRLIAENVNRQINLTVYAKATL